MSAVLNVISMAYISRHRAFLMRCKHIEDAAIDARRKGAPTIHHGKAKIKPVLSTSKAQTTKTTWKKGDVSPAVEMPTQMGSVAEIDEVSTQQTSHSK